MPLPLSQLIYSRFQETDSTRRVITLHRYNQFLEAMKDIGLAVNPDGTVLGLQSSKGVYYGRSVVGYTWFVGPMEQPSPVHFGDAMQEIERFLWDEVDRQPGEEAVLPFLIGEEQGAIMALAMAAAVPDLLSGVIAIDATFPKVPGWDPPLAPLDGLPVLLVEPRPSNGLPSTVLTGDELVATFENWGATVSVLDGSSHSTNATSTDQIARWIASRPVRTRRP